MKIKKFLTVLITALIVFGCNKTQTVNNSNEHSNQAKPVFVSANTQNVNNLRDLQTKLRGISETNSPSVVFIGTEKTIKQRDMFSPFDFFFFGNPNQNREDNKGSEREFKQEGLGSGVIYYKKDSQYFIITNNHVVEGADKIKISVDQQTFYDGTIVGTDPQVDIAVVKIVTKDNLVVAEFGDSDDAHVGDFVIAIGNPYGLYGTMTFGIISAKGRTDLDDGKVNMTNFIQTDAAINPGNSGGPLINIDGQVIGINSMIYSQSGGNVGIGFAIPVNVAKKTADQIIQNGKVEHGYLGIYYKPVDDKTIKQLDLKTSNGMLVNQVIENSPAEKAGILAGDVILEVNGKKMLASSDMSLTIGNAIPGETMNMKILRDNKTLDIKVTIGTRDNSKKIAKFDSNVKSQTYDKYGFDLAELTNELKSKYAITDSTGVIITNIKQNSLADQKELQVGDVIFKINNRSIKSIADVDKQLKDKDYEVNYFFISREGKTMIIMM